MRRAARLWGAALVLLAAGACSSTPAMTRDDARTFASKALHRLGFEQVRVSPSVTAGRYVPIGSHRRVDVWQMRSDVENGGVVVLYVPRRGDSAVFVADVAPDGNRLLTDEQFNQLRRFRLNPADDRRHHRIDRAIWPVIVPAFVLVIGVGAALFVVVLTGRARGGPMPMEAPA